MEITRYQDAGEFYADTEGFLLKHEAKHNLIFGITAGLIEDASSLYDSFYLAVVRDAGDIVAVALRTPPHNLLLSVAVTKAIPAIVNDVHQLYGTLPGVFGPKDVVQSFLTHWQQVSGQSFRLGIAQRIYQLEKVIPITGVPGSIRPATRDDLELLVDWSMEFEIETHGRDDRQQVERRIELLFDSTTRRMVLWENDGPVSLAGASGRTPNGIRVGPVFTPPHLRGNGYASACVAALSQQLLNSGYRYCFLFTDLGNPTSNHIYQRIGYRPVVDVDEYLFTSPDV